MVKQYNKYGTGYPTIWSDWMYPPKGVSSAGYVKHFFKGVWKAQKPNIIRQWSVFASMGFYLWVAYKISFDWAAGSKYNVSIKSDEGNIFYGPPCPIAKEKRRVHRLMEAPHK